MILKIIKKYKEYELNFEKITYLYGQNGEKKEEIINTISTYFSAKGIDDVKILLNDEEISKTYLDVTVFNTIYDIKNEIEDKKGTILNDALVNYANYMNNVEQLDILNNNLETIIQKLNVSINSDTLLYNITYDDIEIKQLIKNNIKIEKNETFKKASNLENIMIMLQLYMNNYITSPSGKIIILNNLDTYLNIKDFKQLIKKLEEISMNSDVKFIVSTSKNGFVNIEENKINNFNVINKGIFSLKNIDELQDFVNKNYPTNIFFEKLKIIETLSEIVQYIYCDLKMQNVNSSVVLKMINDSNGIVHKKIENGSEIERIYLQSD